MYIPGIFIQFSVNIASSHYHNQFTINKDKRVWKSDLRSDRYIFLKKQTPKHFKQQKIYTIFTQITAF